ncbi:hypothetical protein QJQ45_006882 [Haematococcus lacustris]|nr:hypothetical protein QJQ45_006882 [Haematococcus lacustris]
MAIPDLDDFKHKWEASVANEYGHALTVDHPKKILNDSIKREFNDVFAGLICIHLGQWRPDMPPREYRGVLATYEINYPHGWEDEPTPGNLLTAIHSRRLYHSFNAHSNTRRETLRAIASPVTWVAMLDAKLEQCLVDWKQRNCAFPRCDGLARSRLEDEYADVSREEFEAELPPVEADRRLAVRLRELFDEMAAMLDVGNAYMSAWVDNDIDPLTSSHPELLPACLDRAVADGAVGTAAWREQLRHARGTPPPPRKVVTELMGTAWARGNSSGQVPFSLEEAPFQPNFRDVWKAMQEETAAEGAGAAGAGGVGAAAVGAAGAAGGQGEVEAGAAGGLAALEGGALGAQATRLPPLPPLPLHPLHGQVDWFNALPLREFRGGSSGSEGEGWEGEGWEGEGSEGEGSEGEGSEGEGSEGEGSEGEGWEGEGWEGEGWEEEDEPRGRKRRHWDLESLWSEDEDDDLLVGRLMAQQREHDQLQLLMQQQQLQQVRQQQQQQRLRQELVQPPPAEETDANVARAWALRYNMVQAVEAIILSCGTSIQGVVTSIANYMHVPPPVFRVAQAGTSVEVALTANKITDMYSGPSPFSALDFPELTAFTNVAGPGSCLVYNGSGHLALQPHGSGSMTVQSDEADSDSEDEEEVGSRQAAADMETTFGENEEEEEGSELGSEPVQLYAIPPKGRRAALVPASDFQQHVDSAKQELAATADAVPSDEDFLERLAIVKARYCMDATLANGQQAPALLDQQKLSAQQSAFVEVMRCQAEHRVELSSAAANPAKETTKLWRYLAGQPITKADILEYIKLAELALVMTPGSVEEERMFSDMAYLKDDTRNRLQECHLNVCACVFSSNQFDTFPDERAISKWLDNAAVMVWKTNFDCCLEDCVMPGIGRAGQSPLGSSSQALMSPGSRAPAAASNRSSFNHSPLAQQQQQHLAEGQVRPASANQAVSGPWQQQQGGQRRHPEGQAGGRVGRTARAAAPVDMQQPQITHVTAPEPLEFEMEVPPPLNLSGLPDSLAATLQHIVGQLDVLTQTMAMLDERLTMNEDRVRRMDDKMDAVMGGPHTAPALSNTPSSELGAAAPAPGFTLRKRTTPAGLGLPKTAAKRMR